MRKKRRLQNRQKLSTSLRLRIIVATSIFAAACMVFVTVIYFGDVKQSNAFSEGDYRTAGSGDWDDVSVWEYFDGIEWSVASEPPVKGVQLITVTEGNKLTIYDEVALNELVIEANATLDIMSNSIRINKKNGKGGIFCKGVLHLHDVIIDGSGDFSLMPGATLMIGSDAGIDKKGNSGNIQLSGKREFSKEATYVFDGTIKQHTGNGIPSTIENLVIDNLSGVLLDQSFTVTGKLKLVNGILNTGGNDLTIGQSVNTTAFVEYHAGALMGKIKFWYDISVNDSVNFALSDGIQSTDYTFFCDVPKFRKGLIEIYLKPGFPDDASRSPYEARHVVAGIGTAGYYSVNLTNGPDEAWLKLLTIQNPVANRKSRIAWVISSTMVKTDDSMEDMYSNYNAISGHNLSNLFTGPVPFRDDLIIRFHSNHTETAFIAIMNQKGQVVLNHKSEVQRGYNQIKLKIPGDMVAGNYTLQLSTTSEIQTLKMTHEVSPKGAS